MDTSTDRRPAGTLAQVENDLSGTGRSTVRDRTVDIVLFLFALSLWGVELVLFFLMGYVYGTVQPNWYYVLDGVMGLVACLSLWWRRSRPMAVMWAVGLSAAVAVSAMGALFVALTGAAVYRPWRVWIVPFTIVSALVLPWIFLVVPGTGMQLVTLGASVGFMLACMGWGTAIRSRRMLVQRLREDVARARQERERHLDDARFEERRRIAREMHDVVAHRMSLLSVHAGALAYRTDLSREETAAAAGVIRDNAHRALTELREVLGVLRAGHGAGAGSREGDALAEPPQPVLEQVGELLDAARATVEVMLDATGLPGGSLAGAAGMPVTVSRTAYRVVQEALTNACKHAPGSAVVVRLAGGPGGLLTVEVHNDVPPAGSVATPAAPGAGLGLVGLAERVELAGGVLEHGPGSDGCFAVRVWLPWEEE